MSVLDDLKLKYNTANTIEKLIAVNVVCLIVYYIIRAFLFLFKVSIDVLDEWLFFSKVVEEYIFRPWTIISYAFLHDGLWHIASNMIILYLSGRYFITYFSEKKAITVYLLGAISGALLYMLSYNLFPAFAGVNQKHLVGASASVMAILIAMATYAPNLGVRLFFLGSVKFWWIAVFFVLIDVMQIPVSNSGGHLAHLGGALFGFLYALQYKKGNDIGAGFEKLMDGVVAMFQPKKKSPLRTVHKSAKSKPKAKSSYRTTNVQTNRSKSPNQEQIDSILDKISKSGYDSLTKDEKDLLFRAGKE